MTHTLVAIDKRVILNQEETEGCGLGFQAAIKVLSTERLPRLSQCGLKRFLIP